MGGLSLLSLLSFLVFVNLGFVAFFLNKKSRLNRVFLIFCLSMAVWSFGYAFVYASTDMLVQQIWVKISSLGWCTYNAVLLLVVMTYTGSRFAEDRRAITLIFLPGALLIALEFLLFWPSLQTPPVLSIAFYMMDSVYKLFCFAASVILLLRSYGQLKTDEKSHKNQIMIMLLSIALPVMIYYGMKLYSLLAYHTLERFDYGQIYSILSAAGLSFAIYKYGLLNYELLVHDTIMLDMSEMLLQLDGKGKIIKANRQTTDLLGFSLSELAELTISDLFADRQIMQLAVAPRDEAKTYRFAELSCRKKDGNLLPLKVALTVPAKRLLLQGACTILIGQDISLTKQLQMEIAWHKKTKENILDLAYHDFLTGLPNRKLLYEKIGDQIESAEQNDEMFAVFYIDLDNFKTVNDLYGHEAGDTLLCETGRVIKACLRQSDIVARVGGDEFVVLVTGLSAREDLQKITDKLNAALSSTVVYESARFPIEASIGCSIYPADGLNPRELITKADKTMYERKRQRKA